MSLIPSDRFLVASLFRALERGVSGEEEVLRLLAPDAVLVESFTGTSRTHTGLVAIREGLRSLWQEDAPGLTLALERAESAGTWIDVQWTGRREDQTAPLAGSGRVTIRGDRIARLELRPTDSSAAPSRD